MGEGQNKKTPFLSLQEYLLCIHAYMHFMHTHAQKNPNQLFS